MSYGTPETYEERRAYQELERERNAHDMRAATQQRLLQDVGLTATRDLTGAYPEKWFEWLVPATRDAEIRLVAAGFARIWYNRLGWCQATQNPSVIRCRYLDGTWRPDNDYSEDAKKEIRAEVRRILEAEAEARQQAVRAQMAAEAEARRVAEARRAEELALIERLDRASIVLGGSGVWDGGRLVLPSSDIDIFVTLSPQECEKLRTTYCAAQTALYATFALSRDTKRPINFVACDGFHWALTGREAQQAQVLRGSPINFVPAPGNAESSAIRRAGLRLMGVKLCAPGPDVGPKHTLRGADAIENSIRWVEARANAWSDDDLAELAKRVRAAMTSGRDVREVL